MAPRPFAAAAAKYQGRAPYSPQALALLAERFGLDRKTRVLDLGCGPGTLALPLARLVGEVTAIDSEPAMLDAGRARAREAGQDNIRWIESAAEALPPEMGVYRLAVMGQSFHWMDRDRVLERLGGLIEDGGGIALVGPGRRRPQESWEPLAEAIARRHRGERPAHPNEREPHNEPALLRSPCFAEFTVREFSSQIERDAPSVLGCVLSLSFNASLVADAAFARELLAELGRLAPTGRFVETIETEVLIAPKRV